MATPKAVAIDLTPRQKKCLERLTCRRKTPQHLVYRAQIILAANPLATNRKIAQQLSINRLTVGTWRRRWAEAENGLAEIEQDIDDKTLLREIITVLSDAPRPGTPPHFTAEQICQILAIACQPPSDHGCPVSHWTPTELAIEVVNRGIVESISPRHLGRFLKSGGIETPSYASLAQSQH